MSDCSGGRGFRGGLPHLPHLTVRAQQCRQFWAECHCGHKGNRIQKKRDDKVGAPSPCHPLRAATHRQSLCMPLRPFLMPSSAQRAQGIVKNVNPLWSCIRPLRIIHSTPKPATMSPLHHHLRGHCHGTTSLFLPTRSRGAGVILPDVLLAVAHVL